MKEEQKGPRWRSRKGKRLLPFATGWQKESVDALTKFAGFLRSVRFSNTKMLTGQVRKKFNPLKANVLYIGR